MWSQIRQSVMYKTKFPRFSVTSGFQHPLLPYDVDEGPEYHV
jgi:hypothetical protein